MPPAEKEIIRSGLEQQFQADHSSVEARKHLAEPNISVISRHKTAELHAGARCGFLPATHQGPTASRRWNTSNPGLFMQPGLNKFAVTQVTRSSEFILANKGGTIYFCDSPVAEAALRRHGGTVLQELRSGLRRRKRPATRLVLPGRQGTNLEATLPSLHAEQQDDAAQQPY